MNKGEVNFQGSNAMHSNHASSFDADRTRVLFRDSQDCAKAKVDSVAVTPRYVQLLCEPYLPTLVAAGGDVIPNRRLLPHDHRCRCATNLMELATRVFKAMDVLDAAHHAQLCKAKRDVLSAKNRVHDECMTAERLNDGVVVEELRLRLRSSEEEINALRLQLASSQAQVDALLRRLA